MLEHAVRVYARLLHVSNSQRMQTVVLQHRDRDLHVLGCHDVVRRPRRGPREVCSSLPQSCITHLPLVSLQPLPCSSSALRASDLRNSSPSFVAHRVTFCGTMTSYAPLRKQGDRVRAVHADVRQ